MDCPHCGKKMRKGACENTDCPQNKEEQEDGAGGGNQGFTEGDVYNSYPTSY